MERDILFIVNPVAGKGKIRGVMGAIKKKMETLKLPYEIKITKEAREAEAIARDGALKGFKRIAAVGGDGTIYEVLNGIMGFDISLGIIPSGTGNDFARTLGIPLNYGDALEIFLYGTGKWVDCGKVKDRYFLNVGSIGLDAEIVRETHNIKKMISGSGAYMIGLLKTLLNYKSKKIRIKIDGKDLEKEVMLVAVANGIYYGGGMKIAPMAKVEDGLLEICLIMKMSKWKLLYLFPTIFSGKHIHRKEVLLFHGREVQIHSDLPLLINLDGDIIGESPGVFEMVPRGVRVMVSKEKF